MTSAPISFPVSLAVSSRDQRPGMADERAAATPAARRRTPIIVSTRRRLGGFTLIEMMCTVTVAGLLSSVAYPTYQGAVAKTRRADALAATMAVQAAQERYRSGSIAYGSLSEIGAATTSPAGHYTLAVLSPGATGYTVLAAATGSQANDSACRYLKVVADGANLSYRSGASAATVNDADANKRCWNL